MKRYTIVRVAFLVMFISGASLFAQICRVENVAFKQEGKKIIITYDLDGRLNKNYEVSVLLSNNGGISYTIEPQTVTGDVGRKVKPGLKKRILWNMNEDFPEGIEGERFVFAVDAALKAGAKWPYYVLGAGLAGGAVFLAVKTAGEDAPAAGSMKIKISDF